MKIKSGIVFIMICMIFISGKHLFPADFGIKLGISWVNANLSQNIPGVKFSSRAEVIIGGFFSVNLSKILAVQPEVYYVKKGVNFTEENEFTSMEFTYFEIPVLFKLKIITRGKIKPGIFLGPYLAFNTKAMAFEEEYGITTEIDMEDFAKSTDYGLVFGGCVEYQLGTRKLILDIRCNLGLVNVVKNLNTLTSGTLSDDDYVKNFSFTIMIGLGF